MRSEWREPSPTQSGPDAPPSWLGQSRCRRRPCRALLRSDGLSQRSFLQDRRPHLLRGAPRRNAKSISHFEISLMPTLVCPISQSFHNELEKVSKETGDPISHLVIGALSRCLGVPHYTLF